MNSRELLQQATTKLVEHSDVINLGALRATLLDLSHPYYLLLNSAPLLQSNSGGYHVGSSSLSLAAQSVESSANTQPGTPGKLVANLLSAGSGGLFFSGNTPGASLSSAGSALSSMEQKGDTFNTPVSSALCALGSSANSDPIMARTIAASFELTGPVQALLIPHLRRAKQPEIISSGTTPNSFEIGRDFVRVGCTRAQAFRYTGEEVFNVMGSMGNREQITSGSPFLQLHVNRGAGKYSRLSSLERVRAIRADFVALCSLLDHPELHPLSQEQREFVELLHTAPMIGVSHLVRLVISRGVKTWGIDPLPSIMRHFHTFDSRIVSRLFGGKRHIVQDDIQVMYLPANERSKILSSHD